MERNKESTIIGRVAVIGVTAGLLLALTWMGSSYFRFTQLSMTDLYNRPFIFGEVDEVLFLKIANVLITAGISVLLAYIYYYLFRKREGILAGMIFGIICFVPVVMGGIYLVPGYSWDSDSAVSLLCLFLLYGVFLGYSISFNWAEYVEERR